MGKSKKQCEVEGCTGSVVAHGLCDKHRLRLKRHGHLKQTRPDDWGKREKHPLYNSWNWMKRMSAKYSVCEEWTDFWKFVDDMGEKPSPNHQLRRVDNHGNYSPENCKWVEVKPQSQSKNEYGKQWRKDNPDKVKNQDLRKRFGITLEDYNNMLAEQKGGCKICSKTPEDEGRALAVDHCHDTKKIRGLLCTNCNRMLGNAKDSIETLQNAIKYLKT